jgi:hypothetical protein
MQLEERTRSFLSKRTIYKKKIVISLLVKVFFHMHASFTVVERILDQYLVA